MPAFGAPALPPGMKAKKKYKTKTKTKRVNWAELPVSKIKGTFWLDTNEDELEADMPFEDLEQMFSAKPPKVGDWAGRLERVVETRPSVADWEARLGLGDRRP